MVYKKPKKQPQFADLKGILAQTKLDNATYQVIEGLIDRLTQFQSLIVAEIENIIENSKNNGNNGGGSPPIGKHAPTHAADGSDPVQLTSSQITGLDATLANTAKLNAANSFTQPQKITASNKQLELVGTGGAQPILQLTDPSQAVDARKARVLYSTKNFRVDFINDAESNVVGSGILTFNRDTGLFSVSGGGQFNGSVNIGADLIVNGAYKSPNNTLAMIISNNTMAMYNDGYDWVNKANTTYLMRLSSSGVLWTVSTITANGLITSPGFITDGTNNEVAKFVAPNYARAHWRSTGQPPGSQTWVVMNYASRMRIVPTTDDGLTPVGNDWNNGLTIDHTGRVFIGGNGIQIDAVAQGSGLAHGQYIPGASGLTNISAASASEANYLRVGNRVTVSGQATITIVNPGLYQFLLTVPLPNVQYGAGVFQPANSGIQGGYISHNSTYPNFIMFSSYITAGGTQVVFYHYTYNVV